MANKIGKAYAFFDCKASREDIEKELPNIRETVKTPNELEISLTEGFDNLPISTDDAQLLQFAEKAKDVNLKYFIEANYPNHGNRETADEISAVLNQASLSPLDPEGKQIRGTIVYKHDKRYFFR